MDAQTVDAADNADVKARCTPLEKNGSMKAVQKGLKVSNFLQE